MSAQKVELERDEGIATIRLSNAPTHTLTAAGVLEMHRILDDLENDSGLRVLVLTGGGEGVFVAHYEVGELADQSEQSQGANDAGAQGGGDLHAMHRLCLRLEALSAPTVAALNGSAAGGGFELALACDFRLAADGDFVFGLPETSVGIIPGAGGTQRMARMIGTARALDLILHARLLRPGEAHELDLIHRLVPADRFADAVAGFTRDLASRAPVALAAAKRAIHEGAALPMEAALSVEQEQFGRAMRSKDAAGAMRAWLKGETWDWTGE